MKVFITSDSIIDRQWYQDEEPEKPKKEELKLLHMSVLGEEKELILVENNEIYLNTVAKVNIYTYTFII